METFPTITQQTLKQHLKESHNINTFSTYLREIVYGGSDGIVTTFAVVAGFSGANRTTQLELPIFLVLLFGMANLFADGASMGLGSFLSTRSEQKARKRQANLEREQLASDQPFEIAETQYLLQEKGFDHQQAQQLTQIMATNKPYWLEFMLMYELDMPQSDQENPLFIGLATFFSFIFFGAIPLLPYLIANDPQTTFAISIVFTVSALLLLGSFRWKITNENLWHSVSEVLLIGGVAAAIAYIVGTLFA